VNALAVIVGVVCLALVLYMVGSACIAEVLADFRANLKREPADELERVWQLPAREPRHRGHAR